MSNDVNDNSVEGLTVSADNVQTEAPVSTETPEVSIDAPAETSVGQDDVAEKPDTEIKVNSHNVNTKQSISVEDIDNSIPTIVLPSGYSDELEKLAENLPNIDIAVGENARNWADNIIQSANLIPTRETFKKTLNKINATWSNVIEVNNLTYRSAVPKVVTNGTSAITGERANLTAMNFLGIGSLFTTALYHSGFWVTFKPVPDEVMIEFNRLILEDKITAGRNTYGLALSNMAAITINRIFDLMVSYIYSTTLKPEVTKKFTLGELIDVRDIYSMIWGFMAAQYPRGFNYERSCIADPQKCQHVYKARINLGLLQWVNTNELSDKQKIHMHNRVENSMDLESIKRYTADFAPISVRCNKYFEGTPREFSITIKVPKVNEYIKAGMEWVDRITDLVNKAMEKDASTRDKVGLINTHCNATLMRQYVHWIDSIEIAGNTHTDKETIEILANTFSAHTEILDQFIDNVLNFIDDSSIVVIAVPNHNCPACGAKQTDTHKHIDYLIPIDVQRLFFDLSRLRIQRLTLRN